MQYEQAAGEIVSELPSKSIDTGMGLERIAAVLQGVHDNYDIDLFRGLIEASEELTHTKAEGEHKASHRVIADHLRASRFPRRRRRAAGQRGQGLRPAPDHAPRHAPRPSARRQGAADVAAGAGAGRGNGRRLSRAGARAAADRGDAAAGGDAFPADAGQRSQAARRSDCWPCRRRHACRRDGVQALRHLRLPLRPDRGRAARARPAGRSRRLRRGDGRAEGQGARGLEGLGLQGQRGHLVRSCRAIWRDRVHRLFGRRRRRRRAGDRQRRRARRHCRDRRDRRDPAQPDAFLRRERRADRRHWKADHSQGFRRRS